MTSVKKKTKKQSPESFPYDLLLTCFARVPRMYYPTLSLVSKSCRTLLASPDLCKTRSLLNHRESCLYVCLKFPYFDPNPRLFTLCQKPNRTLTNIPKKKNKKSTAHVLVPAPVPNPPPKDYKMVAVGSNIYAIGGTIENAPSSSVSVLDCQSHTWHKAPSMLMDRNYPAVNVVDGKIYVAGGLKDFTSSNWMEVFDPNTQTWELISRPLDKICRHMYKSLVIEGDIYHFGDNVVAYKPKEDKWIAITKEHPNFLTGWFQYSYCMIDNVMYCYHPAGGVLWYDSKLRCWNKLKGLEGLPNFGRYSAVKLADCGGKLVVLWDKYVRASRYKEIMIWCAEISLEKCNWSDAVLTVPKSYYFVSAIYATY
ncbi:PREDICTED: F-box/kelch-repeat protein At5g49000-like [Camelina sativa]|uniref:F-box/kelch-repeat protein At5g49000-like n=1 Tax=Camelina sativa TaxID=90675 RepID=A0ABM0WIX0_CAMSA|nr:PREDICTED: F-box/kelch-repeat protein At5g49000-like [Camelina sativa]